MTTEQQDALRGSLIREDLQDVAGPAIAFVNAILDVEPRGAQQLRGCLAALSAGEPKRGLSLLSPSHQSERVTAALTSWARQLDRNWYPGGVGAETPMDPADMITEAGPGRPVEELLECVVVNGFPALTVSRAVLEFSLRNRNEFAVQQVLSLADSGLDTLMRYAVGRWLTDIANWAVLATADLMHRAGLPQAHELLDGGRRQMTQTGDSGRLALSQLIEGDWYAAPGSSPEALGWDLAPQRAPSSLPAPDFNQAAACYRRAQEIANEHEMPRLCGALALRFAMLDRISGDKGSRRRHLETALTAARAAGDSAGQHLAAIHQLVADIDDGLLGQHALDLGGGWHTPNNGPVAEVLTWAQTVGSLSWCVGLGRLLQRCGDQWAKAGSAPRARIAYLAALPLISAEPAVPSHSLVTAVADSDIRNSLAVNALLRLQRVFGPLFADAHNTDGAAFAQKLEASWVMVSALRDLSRGSAAPLAADRMARLRDELAQASENLRGVLPDVEGRVPQTMEQLGASLGMEGDGSLQEQMGAMLREMQLMQQMNLDQATTAVGVVDVLVPLGRAETAERAGQTSDAERWYTEAIEEARRESAPKHLLPIALIGARRYEEARAALVDRSQEIADAHQLPLWVRVKDYDNATATLARLQAAGSPPEDWRGLLTCAEISLGQGQLNDARRSSLQAINSFEDSVRTLLRDPERLEACDQPDVAAMYATLALTYLQPGVQPSDAHVNASFEAAEMARALTYDIPADTVTPEIRRAWQRAAAEYSAIANRLLARLAHSSLAQTAPDYEALDQADVALAAAEHAADSQDPGVLMRRTRPGHRLNAADLRQQLPPGTLLLEYLTVGDDLLSWAMSTDVLRPVRQAIHMRDLSALVRKVHSACANGHADATELTRLLLKPFGDLLRNHPRVVVVPFGPLNLVPFHALRVDDEPLALGHVVSYLPQAGLLLEGNVHHDRPASRSRPLIVGDPAFDPDQYPVLQRLPGAEVEAAVVGATLQVPADNVLVGPAASEAAVNSRLEASDLLHISSHGHLDELSPFASSLVLAGNDELTVADIAGLRFGTDLAVLTGCDTGRGNATLGGDVVGLTRSLLRSGVNRTVVSLWPVDDTIAPVVMHRFYAGLVRGLPPAHALAEAQRQMHRMNADELRAAYLELGGNPDSAHSRRGRDLGAEHIGDQDAHTPLAGSAERYWASFVLIG